MQQNEMIATLQRYKAELDGILLRFKKDRDGIHIQQNDDARFREIALELRDLFDDAFVDGHRHSQPLLGYFNDSISNYVGSPSYRGVENVKGLSRLPLHALNVTRWHSRMRPCKPERVAQKILNL